MNMNELLAHLVGDYILQSHWMAVNKSKRWLPAIIHGICYTLPFLLITLNPVAVAIICVTHIIIDRFALAKYVARVKNWTFTDSGYPEETPIWLWIWLNIILDNTIHIFINHLALAIK